jgi:hypothetical protein
MLAQPSGQGGGFSVSQQLDRATGDHVDHDRAVDVAATQREVVNTEHRQLTGLRVR